jgi:2'-5' RNA ligase
MRLFLAINLSDPLRRDVWRATEPLRDALPEIGWVREPLLHLTLKFLGEQPDAVVNPLETAMTEVGQSHAKPVLRLTELGAFPTLRRARVVWAGVEPEPRLELLHHDLEVACERVGFELDGRAFRPHLTLGRVRRPLGAERARVLERMARKLPVAGECQIRTIDLMQSVATAEGRRYDTVFRAPLRRD